MSTSPHRPKRPYRTIPAILCGLVIGFCGVLASRCSSRPPADAATPPQAGFYGDITPVFSVKELMAGMIDPISDHVFDAVGWDTTTAGTVHVRPRTDEDWEKVRIGAVTLAEGISLLKIRRPWAPAGDVNNSVGPNAPELSPTQIQALVTSNPALWNSMIERLKGAALEVIEVTKKRDADALFAAAGDLDTACESCHLTYWYPGDRKLVEDEATHGHVSRVPPAHR